MTRAVLTFIFFISLPFAYSASDLDYEKNKTKGLLSLLEDKLDFTGSEYLGYLTKWLEGFNDRHLGVSALGRMLHYEEIKPKLLSEAETARSKSQGRMKKMAMAMMPLIFHVGATSTWMMITSIMAAKSVAIGMILLIFKIAVSSAKLASFFTLLKGKHEEHHGWSSWSPPHYEHHGHGHDRSFSEIEPPSHDYHSYTPEWTPNDIPHDYHTLPSYKHNEHDYLYESPTNADKKKSRSL